MGNSQHCCLCTCVHGTHTLAGHACAWPLLRGTVARRPACCVQGLCSCAGWTAARSTPTSCTARPCCLALGRCSLSTRCVVPHCMPPRRTSLPQRAQGRSHKSVTRGRGPDGARRTLRPQGEVLQKVTQKVHPFPWPCMLQDYLWFLPIL